MTLPKHGKYQPLIDAALAIVRARDHHADHGVYDAKDFHPEPDQTFEDWAADLLETALGPVPQR